MLSIINNYAISFLCFPNFYLAFASLASFSHNSLNIIFYLLLVMFNYTNYLHLYYTK